MGKFVSFDESAKSGINKSAICTSELSKKFQNLKNAVKRNVQHSVFGRSFLFFRGMHEKILVRILRHPHTVSPNN